MHPTSPAQFEAANSNEVPGLERVREGLYTVGLRQPGSLPHFAFTYLLLDTVGAVHLVDAGWDSDENWSRLAETLSALDRGVADVATVTITHLHPDHLGMAARIRAASGARVALHAAEQEGIAELSSPAPDSTLHDRLDAWGVPQDRRAELVEAFRRRSGWPAFTADRLLESGEELRISGHSVRVVHTPGHTAGHLALVDELHGVVYLGDLLLPNQFPGIGLGGTPTGNPIEHYLESLDLVSQFDAFEALPGHGYRFTGIAEHAAETAAHHEARTAEVALALEAAGSERAVPAPTQAPAHLSTEAGSSAPSVWDIASGLTWTAGWNNLSGLALLSALSQTALHVDRVSR